MMVMIMMILAQTTQQPSNSTAVAIVGLIGAFVGVFGTYFAVKGQTKQVEISSEDKEREAILRERDQLATEWKALREFQTVQLLAAQKERETLENQVALLKKELEHQKEAVVT